MNIPIEIDEKIYGLLEMHLKHIDDQIKELLDITAIQIGILLAKDRDSLFSFDPKICSLFEQNPLSIQVLDSKGHTISVNRKWRTLWGMSEDDANTYITNGQHNIFNDVFFNDQHEVAQIFRQAYQGKSVTISQMYYNPINDRKPGSGLWVELQLGPVLDESGNVRNVIIVYQDMTGKIEYEKILRKSEEKFKSVFYKAPLAMSFTTIDGDFIMLNEAFCNLLGYSEQELMQKNVKDIMNPMDRYWVDQGKDKVLKGEIENCQREKRYLKKNGEMIIGLVNISVLTTFESEKKYLLAAIQDVTELKKAEFNIKKSLKDQEFLTEASFILGSSLNFRIIMQKIADLAVDAICDWCSVDLLEENNEIKMAAIAHRDSILQNYATTLRQKYSKNLYEGSGVARVIRTGCSQIFSEFSEKILLDSTQDNEYTEFLEILNIQSAVIVPLKARGKSIGAITLISSSRQLTQDDLTLAEELGLRAGMSADLSLLYDHAQVAIKTRDNFLSLASHELRTPLSSAMMQLEFTQQLSKDIDSYEQRSLIEKSLQTSVSQLDRLVVLIEDLLDVSRIQAGKLSFLPEMFDIKKVIHEVVSNHLKIIEASGNTIEIDVVDNIAVCWDRMRFEQVLINLISNACKYAAGTKIEIHVHLQNEIVCLEFGDAGPGIISSNPDKIFQRFERSTRDRNINGLGLGLYIVRSIVEAHSGTIVLEAIEGKPGTTFLLQIPLKPKFS